MKNFSQKALIILLITGAAYLLVSLFSWDIRFTEWLIPARIGYVLFAVFIYIQIAFTE